MLVKWRLAEPHGKPNLKFFHLALLISVVTVLAGCETVQDYVAEWTGSRSEPRLNYRVGPKLAPAPLPRYAVGRSFAFDDGRQETVLRVTGEFLTWRKNRFSTAVAYRNFLIPSLSWESRTRRAVHASPPRRGCCGRFGSVMTSVSKSPRLSRQRAIPGHGAARPVASSNTVGAASSSARKD